jgi:hypothetical protein
MCSKETDSIKIEYSAFVEICVKNKCEKKIKQEKSIRKSRFMLIASRYYNTFFLPLSLLAVDCVAMFLFSATTGKKRGEKNKFKRIDFKKRRRRKEIFLKIFEWLL